MAKKSIIALLSISELLRLACIYAEAFEVEFLTAIKGTDQELEKETADFIRQLRKYRLKRWGKTKLEVVLDSATAIPAYDMAREQKIIRFDS